MKYVVAILLILVATAGYPATGPLGTPAPAPTADPNAPNYREMKCSYTGVGEHQKWTCDYTKVCKSGLTFVPRSKGSPDVGTCESK